MSPMMLADAEADAVGPTPIAVVGYSFEFPQEATSSESFWQMLCEGRCASTDFPKDRINIDAFYHPDRSRQTSIAVRGGSFVTEPLGAFDAPFFSITPAEAACMDPQHRKMLETAYHAFEDAGIPLQTCSGSNTSVYTGSFTDDYRSIMQQDFESEHMHAATGIAFSMLANRLSWFFNLKGASVNLDSACSSSLSALHLACQDLLAHTADMALVGGANFMYHPDFMRFLSNLHFLSPDSRCWSFDARGNGYARGEGVAVLVLKRLPDALAAGDRIRAVIRATGLNQDGRTPGITVPNEDAQVDLITRTYRAAALAMEPTRYFEAHGTGTAVGDPIEASAIGRSFGHVRSPDDPLYVGAVKANIGHLEGCSGLAGVIKTLLVLEKGFIPPIAGLETLNPKLAPEKWNLRFPRVGIPWPAQGLRRACVNSFGFGGTNATVIMDDVEHFLELYRPQRLAGGLQEQARGLSPSLLINGASNGHEQDSSREHSTASSINEESVEHITSAKPSSITSRRRLLAWSAFDEDGAKRLAEQYGDDFVDKSANLDEALYVLSQRRTLFSWRGYSILDPHEGLSQPCLAISEPTKATENRRVAFVFTGQGAQYQGMGRELLAFPVFSASIDGLNEDLQSLGASWSIHEFMAGHADKFVIDNPAYAQPLTTCIQIALVDLLKSWSIAPSLVMGHSSGEIAAAYAAGALSRSAAVKVAYERGRVSSLVAGQNDELGMMAVGLSVDEVKPYIQRLADSVAKVEVTVACVNSPKSVTLSGRAKQLDALKQYMEADAVFARRLRVPTAYHSAFMQTVADDYATAMGILEAYPQGKSVPLMSSVTGDIVIDKTLRDPQYWVRNMVSPVQFDAAFSRVLAQANRKMRKQLGKKSQETLQITDVVEIGPHGALKGPIRDITSSSKNAKKPKYYASLLRGEDADVAVLKLAGSLHCAGVAVDLAKVNHLERRPIDKAVSLPRYPFNHKRIYWEESRLSKSVRFPKHARNDILGTIVPDGNPHSPQWRNIIRTNHLPWVEDHRIQGECIFPASGSLVMAVEAFKQVFGDNAQLQGCELRDVAFVHPIDFASGVDKVETRLNLSLPPANADRCSAWSEFRVFMVDDKDQFIECCSGAIRGCKIDTSRKYSYPIPSLKSQESLSEWLSSTDSLCTESMDMQAIYDAATPDGVQYGPCFQVLDRLRLGRQKEAVAEIKTGQWRIAAESALTSLHPVHPTVLDATMQLLTLALSQGRQDFPTMMPSRITNAYIDCQHTDVLNDGRIGTSARSWLRGYRRAGADIVATELNSSDPLIWIQGMEATFIDGFDTSMSRTRKTDPHLCMRLTWKPDVSTMNNQQIQAELTRDRPNGPPNQVELHRMMTLAASAFVYEALDYIESHPPIKLPKYLDSYIEWMKYQQKRVQDGLFTFSEKDVLQLLASTTERMQLVDHVQSADSEGKMMMIMGRNLIPILRLEVDPLNILFGDGLADEYYEVMLSNPYHSHPSRAYLELLSFKDPSMKILEVGAGTGGQTLACLEALSTGGVKKFLQYDYTDISAGFFTQARAKFAEYEHLMNFKTFNVENDPVPQGFEAGTYDLIVASHVIHATATLDGSLTHMRKLLKPGGKLLLFETTRPEYLLIGFVFGLLHGWWSPLDNESRAEYSPCVSTATWSEHLQRSGFSGVDMEFLGQQEAECQYSSIIVATAVEPRNSAKQEDDQVTIVINPDVKAQCTLAKALKQRFVSSKTYTLSELAHNRTPPTGPIVFLVEVDAVLLYNMTEREYDIIQSIFTRLRNTLWVSQSSSAESDPRHRVVYGMARTLLSEDSTRKFVSLVLEDGSEDAESAAAQIANTLALQDSQIEDLETNIVVKNGVQHINRVTENRDINDMIAHKASTHRIEEVHFDARTPLVLRMAAPGSLHTLRYCQDDMDLSLADDELLVEVRAFGLNTHDYLSASGHLNELNLGSECAGIVRSVGKACMWKVGDRVAAIGSPTARTLFKTTTKAVISIPDHVSFTEAAGMHSAVWTAYHSLFEIGRADEDDTVLIHDAASSVGQILIQMARTAGVTILVTSKSEASTALLKDSFDLTDSSILTCAESLMPGEIHRITQGRGVDVFVGPLASDSLRDYARCLAPFGRLIDTEAKEQNSGSLALATSMPKNITQATVDFTEFLKYNPTSAFRTFQKAMKFASSSAIAAPKPLHVFQAGDVESAFRHFEQKDAVGQVVIELAPDDAVQAFVPNKAKYRFAADKTYLIAGGLGGLGRSFSRWMVDRGARYLVLLSRSGVKTEPAAELVAELRAKGVTVATPACDVTSLDALVRTMDEVSKTMPPVLGCIQATVALRDATFENMSYDDWKIGLDSKAIASWNLHHALPKQLDFFVIISSLNGIFGGRGQANYAAGNTFKDALAHHRISHGQKAVSIDLGLMVDEGIVAENQQMLASLRRVGHLKDIQRADLLALMDHYCDASLPLLAPADAQVLVGAELPANVLAKGVDIHHSIRRPISRQLFRMGAHSEGRAGANAAGGSGNTIDRAAALREAADDDEAARLATEWFAGKVAHVLGLPASEVDTAKPVHTYGVDSLLAIDLKNWLQKELGAEIPVFQLLGNVTMAELGAAAAAKSVFRKQSQVQTA